MSVISVLESIFIGPLKVLFEMIFQFADSMVENPGLSIIFLSLTMNILVLPLYKRADAMQEEARDVEAKLHDGVAHIKKSFSGDEKMMILQTYYRQNNYKPTQALKGSVSLLLEIPFFMAAYQFLSNLGALNGASLGPITDLGKPDGLLVIGGIAINVLPVLMTLINVISSAIYLKGFPLKTKLQLYGMALFFLVFLYTSPSGLVFYWTLNNLFSLVKTIFYKLKNPKKIITVLCAIAGIAVLACGAFVLNINSLRTEVFVLAVGLGLELPVFIMAAKKIIKPKKKKAEVVYEPNGKMFLVCSVFLTVLVGLLIPSAVISSSPGEFVDMTYFYNPLWYIVSSLCLSAGLFLVWLRVFYWLATPKGKCIFDRAVFVLCFVMVVNYMFFGTKMGVILTSLQYETGLTMTRAEQLLNLGVVAVVSVLLYFVARKWGKKLVLVSLILTVALGAMSAVNMVKINSEINSIKASGVVESDNDAQLKFSKNGQNVVVLSLDRALGQYIPYLVNEKPELKEMFDGFTYYSNVISYGGHTNFAAPAMAGGYEYTPVELNKRDTEKLADKHNEALKVMPAVFSDAGYDVTVCDPAYAGYHSIPDLSIYDDYPEIETYITKNMFRNKEDTIRLVENNHRNFFCFSLMKTMPMILQSTVYDNGNYLRAATANEAEKYTHVMDGLSKASGYKESFMCWYNVLDNMDTITKIEDEANNNFTFMFNDATHEVVLVQEPEYVPADTVDNTEYDNAHKDRFTVDGKTLSVTSELQMAHYETNMTALLRIGEWLDFLKENGVYDNTRIIIVSDHGYGIGHDANLNFSDENYNHYNTEFYFPLLLVKDFDSTGFTVSDEFMTNADVPTLATKGIIDNPTNPFTGKAINSDEKYAHEQCVILSGDHSINKNNGTQYIASEWASISENLHNRDNWKFGGKTEVLTEHKVQ